jgi:hypothetical protein
LVSASFCFILHNLFGYFSFIILSKLFIRRCLRSSILFCIDYIFISFLISSKYIRFNLVRPLTVLMYLISELPYAKCINYISTVRPRKLSYCESIAS